MPLWWLYLLSNAGETPQISFLSVVLTLPNKLYIYRTRRGGEGARSNVRLSRTRSYFPFETPSMTSHARVEPYKGVFPVCSTYRPTMKIILFVIYAGFVLPVHSDERHAYCESCLATAKEIEKEMKDVPAEDRQRVVEKLISGDVCEKLLTYKQVPEDKIKSSCMDLLGSHYEQIHSALLTQELKRLDIVLCYEQSTACVGVKHLSFEDARKRTFAESDIEALLQDNKENVRFAQPVHAELPDHPKEEL